MNKESNISPSIQCSNLYGLLIGEWAFDWYDRTLPSSSRHLTGEWIFSRAPKHFGIIDTFICPSRQECKQNNIPVRPRITQRFYDHRTDQWMICDSTDNNYYHYSTEFTHNQIIITDKNNPDFLIQWIYEDIQLYSFHWLCQISPDQGKSWNLVEEIFAKRQK